MSGQRSRDAVSSDLSSCIKDMSIAFLCLIHSLVGAVVASDETHGQSSLQRAERLLRGRPLPGPCSNGFHGLECRQRAEHEVFPNQASPGTRVTRHRQTQDSSHVQYCTLVVGTEPPSVSRVGCIALVDKLTGSTAPKFFFFLQAQTRPSFCIGHWPSWSTDHLHSRAKPGPEQSVGRLKSGRHLIVAVHPSDSYQRKHGNEQDHGARCSKSGANWSIRCHRLGQREQVHDDTLVVVCWAVE